MSGGKISHRMQIVQFFQFQANGEDPAASVATTNGQRLSSITEAVALLEITIGNEGRKGMGVTRSLSST